MTLMPEAVWFSEFASRPLVVAGDAGARFLPAVEELDQRVGVAAEAGRDQRHDLAFGRHAWLGHPDQPARTHGHHVLDIDAVGDGEAAVVDPVHVVE
jgi:hypothetical protein